MFKVFSDDKDKGVNVNGQSGITKSEISEKVFAVLATSEFTLGTIKAVQDILGVDKVKKLEKEIAEAIIKDLNSKDTQGEAFLVAVLSLLHYASALERLEENFLNWRDK